MLTQEGSGAKPSAQSQRSSPALGGKGAISNRGTMEN
jgi:hypothetical protein